MVLALVGCGGQEADGEWNPPLADLTSLQTPDTPFGAFVASFDRRPRSGALSLVASDGTQIELSDPVFDDGLQIVWRADWLEPGDYAVVSAGGIVSGRRFEILPYGTDAGFRDAAVGDAYRLDLFRPEGPVRPVVAELAMDTLGGEVVLEVMGVEGSTVDYRLLLAEEGSVCSAHQGSAEVSADGVLEATPANLVFPAFGGLWRLEEGSLVIALDGDSAAGQLTGSLATEGVDTLLPPEITGEACDTLAAVGDVCEPCPSGEGTCLALLVDAISGQRDSSWAPGTVVAPCEIPALE